MDYNTNDDSRRRETNKKTRLETGETDLWVKGPSCETQGLSAVLLIDSESLSIYDGADVLVLRTVGGSRGVNLCLSLGPQRSLVWVTLVCWSLFRHRSELVSNVERLQLVSSSGYRYTWHRQPLPHSTFFFSNFFFKGKKTSDSTLFLSPSSTLFVLD